MSINKGCYYVISFNTEQRCVLYSHVVLFTFNFMHVCKSSTSLQLQLQHDVKLFMTLVLTKIATKRNEAVVKPPQNMK